MTTPAILLLWYIICVVLALVLGVDDPGSASIAWFIISVVIFGVLVWAGSETHSNKWRG